MKQLIKVFFAIPCGEFYENQKFIIIKICELYNIQPIINEIDYSTDSLLDQIFEQILQSDFFIADISSNSPNVIFELGYAFSAKHISKIGILLSNVSKCPSDLQDIKRMQYGSFKEFADKLNNWLSSFFQDPLKKIDDTFIPIVEFYETFQDVDKFLKIWEFPLGCDYSLTYNGFRFTRAHFPIISRHLAYLDNFIFEFDCLINFRVIGWIVKGTKLNYEDSLIDFCIMFNLNNDGYICPHIFSKAKIDPNSHYHPFERIKIPFKIDYSKRLNIKTFVDVSKIKVLINNQECFNDDFTKKPYDELYNSMPNKTNQIGFRCHPGEEATVYFVKVNQIK